MLLTIGPNKPEGPLTAFMKKSMLMERMPKMST